MALLNPKPMGQPVLTSSWKPLEDSVGRMTEVALPDPSLKLTLETRPSPEHPLVEQLVKVVNEMPTPALLFTQTGKIVTVNPEARLLISESKGNFPWHHVPRLWQALGWPAVPFHRWNWQGSLVSAWDCPIGQFSNGSNLTLRYLRQESLSDHEGSQERLAVLGQEFMRVIHDIRQPLTSVEWFATLLGQEGQSIQERKQLVDNLVQATRMLDGLLENLLNFTKPIEVNKQRVRVSRLLNEVEWLAIPPLHHKQITIHRLIEPGVEELWADDASLKRAILNVVLNAIQASPPGGRLDISCHRVIPKEFGEHAALGNQAVQFLIRDHGCGIPTEEMNKIFDPFFSKRKGGTGLGLSIVKHIVQAHHGLIDVQSEQGTGTTVRLVLPQ